MELPSVAFFNPQSKAFKEEYLKDVREYLHGSQILRPFVHSIATLPETWDTFAKQRDNIASLTKGSSSTQVLSEWITTGKSPPMATAMNSCLALPLLTILQLCQYFQFLELKNLKHSQFTQKLREGGGVQGYCGGLLAAMAIAASPEEVALVENASRALRVALAIGSYADLDDEFTSGESTITVIRLKHEGQGDEIIEKFPRVT